MHFYINLILVFCVLWFSSRSMESWTRSGRNFRRNFLHGLDNAYPIQSGKVDSYYFFYLFPHAWIYSWILSCRYWSYVCWSCTVPIIPYQCMYCTTYIHIVYVRDRVVISRLPTFNLYTLHKPNHNAIFASLSKTTFCTLLLSLS